EDATDAHGCTRIRRVRSDGSGLDSRRNIYLRVVFERIGELPVERFRNGLLTLFPSRCATGLPDKPTLRPVASHRQKIGDAHARIVVGAMNGDIRQICFAEAPLEIVRVPEPFLPGKRLRYGGIERPAGDERFGDLLPPLPKLVRFSPGADAELASLPEDPH